MIRIENLTERDVKVLEFIYQNRFADVEVIKDAFWPERTGRNHYRRLNLLLQRGYVNSMVGDSGHLVGFQVSRRGLTAIRRLGSKRIGKGHIRPLYKTAFQHDKILIRLRRIFEESPLISHYTPEHELRAALAKKHGRQEKRDERYKVPDALFHLKTPTGHFKVALELELSIKSKVRYATMMRQLCISDDFSVVFFVASDEALRKVLEDSLAEVRSRDRLVQMWKYRHAFYFVLLKDLLELRLRAPWKGEGTIVILDEIAKEIKAG